MGNWFTNLFKGKGSEAQVDEKIQPESGNMQMPQEQASQSMDMGMEGGLETESTNNVEMPGLNEESGREEITNQEETEEDKKEL